MKEFKVESEEEIINIIKTMLEKNDEIFDEVGTHLYFSKSTAEDIKGLLDLYNKEKEKNKRIKDGILYVGRKNGKSYELKMVLEEYISKDKIREKIEKLEKDYKEINQYGDFIIADTIQPRIEILKELLED